ncbi:MAG TPA: DNA repair protein RecN [Myxococcales bacterium]|nr:DNA repair protein RecN [Myxococcales bacterium]HIK84040.1 DNA repair protein RecN [Myxococcales bacterium]
MIEVLRIDNLALVESVELEFSSGLNVLTGETGTGKSIVLSALALLAGGRAAAESLRSGAEEGAVEALFRMDGHEDVARELIERGLSSSDASGDEESSPELIVRRTLHANGRSRARVGGQLVPVSTLVELFGGQLEISSQHGSQALRNASVHGLALDAFAGKTSLREIVAREVTRVVGLDEEIAELRAAEEERARRLDFLQYQQSELENEELDAEGIASLEAEHRRLTHAERLAEEMARVSAALGGIDAGPENESAESAIATARRALTTAMRMDPSLEDLEVRLGALESELLDLAATASDYLGELEIDPRRLAEVEEKIGGLEKLRRKYGQSIEEMLSHRDDVAREIEALTGADDRIRLLEAERSKAVDLANDASARLSTARARAAKKLAKAVQSELSDLAMQGARFVVSLEKLTMDGRPTGLETGIGGRERPEFHFSANEGEAPRPIQKVASGGELSRLFLAIKNSLRRASRNMVIVFDEVDAGIGGAVAERVGRVLAELATEHQVLCITHLPQIAAFADRHFVVRKTTRAGRTRTQVDRVEGDLRVDELARMAGGEEVTEVTREHARSLLNP